MADNTTTASAPARTLTVTGLWSFARGTLYMERNPRGERAVGHSVAPFEGENEEAYRERMRAAWPVKDGLMKKVMASDHVILALSAWRDGLEGDPLVKVFAEGLMASGFAYAGIQAPHPHPRWQCRMAPWCGNNGCEASHAFCVDCYEAMSVRTQIALARVYNPQQRFTGNAKLWVNTLNADAMDDIVQSIMHRSTAKTGEAEVHRVG